jgi:hypothetical protein
MRGRHPSGPEYVDHLHGSSQAKERLRLILETMTGKMRVQEACQLLEISEQRFDQLRTELLQAALASLESKPAGRPPRGAPNSEDELLRAQVEELQAELRASQVREEIALVLHPKQTNQSTPEQAQADSATQKKTPRQKRRARPGWWRH